MIIRGNTVGSTALPTDYNQTDPARADFLANKPDAAIVKAQQTADSAAKTAGAALPRTGGTMTGDITMDGGRVTGLPAPESDTDAVNRGYLISFLEGKRFCGELLLTASGWSDTAPYTQTVSVPGILATDRPHYGPVYSPDTALAQKEAFSMVDDLDTGDGTMTFTCFEERPAADLVVQLEVNR